MNFTPTEITTLRKAYDVVKVFRDIDPNISSITMATILEVAIRGDHGVSVKYLEKTLGIASASASRQLQVIEKPNKMRTKGFGLARPEFDPEDAKGKLRVPIEGMQAVVSKLQSALS